MGIGGVIGYFVFRGCYEESFVLWRAQKMERTLRNIDAFSSEKAAHLQHLAAIEREKDIYNTKLLEIRSKCADLRAEIDKLMKSRRDMTKLKELLVTSSATHRRSTNRHQVRPGATPAPSTADMRGSRLLLGAANGSEADRFLQRDPSLVNVGSGSCVTIVRPAVSVTKPPSDKRRTGEKGATPSPALTQKQEISNLRSQIAKIIEQLGGIRGQQRKPKFKQMLRHSRDEVMAKKRTWRIEVELEMIENQLRTETRLRELKRLGISDDDDDEQDLPPAITQHSTVDVSSSGAATGPPAPTPEQQEREMAVVKPANEATSPSSRITDDGKICGNKKPGAVAEE